ncbi:hypothetical protein HanRHA438_Chr12g0575851 [Helianthus annuus]|nr:hypothetical protein HanRHA438_Chr12g0575851 [Helianthus annuus]
MDLKSVVAPCLNACEGVVEVGDDPPVGVETVFVTLLKIAASGEFGGNFKSSTILIYQS